MTDEPVQTRAARTTFVALLAYAELRAMESLARGAALAPDPAGRLMLLDLAGQRHDNHRLLRAELGTGADTAMLAAAGPVDDFHAHTEARTWPEVLVSLYAGDGLATDFHHEAAAVLPAALVTTDDTVADFAVGRIRALVADEPRLAGRLTLWARRVVGEAMTQAQRLVGNDPDLAGLLTGTETGPDLAEANRLFGRLLSRHTTRMAELGMSA